MTQRKAMIESESPLSVRRQCQLLEVNRNRLKPPPAKFADEDAAPRRLRNTSTIPTPASAKKRKRQTPTPPTST